MPSPHHAPVDLGQRRDWRATLAAALADSGQRIDLDRLLGPPDAPRARQTAPNAANARQSAPPMRKLQNEPNPPSSRADPCHSAPNSANARRAAENCKTNPSPRPARPLTPDHLRAAGLLVAGYSTNDVAATLEINRHTLARWKRLPLFQREIRRLIDPADPA